MSHHVSWFAGIDLGDRTHHVHLTDATGAVLGKASFSHGGRGVAQLLSWLLDTTGADSGSIGVALEAPHGAVVDGLLDRGFATFAVNPKQADRARELLTLSGAKDDPRDAEGLALALRVIPRIYRRLQPKHPVLVLLRATLRDLAALRSGGAALSGDGERLQAIAGLATESAFAEALLLVEQADRDMYRSYGNKRMQFDALLLAFNEIARPLVLARRRAERAK